MRLARDKDSRRGPFAYRLAARIWLALGVASIVASSAFAQDAPVDTVLKALDLKTDAGQPADFVKASRPKTEGDYLPVGTRHPDRPIKVKTPAELKAMEADLDAARSRQDKIAGRKPPPDVPPKTPGARAPAGPPTTQN